MDAQTEGAQPAATQPAGWYADYTGRWAGRYFNGRQWTAVVSDENGRTSEDLVEGVVRVDRRELKAIRQGMKDASRQTNHEARDRERFLRTPVGRARVAFERGDRVFQYSHDVMSQQAIIVAVVGSRDVEKHRRPVRDPQRRLR